MITTSGSRESNLSIDPTYKNSKGDPITSFIRRKPQITYKSPTAEDHVCLNIPASRPSTRPPSLKPSPSRRMQIPEPRDARYNKSIIYPTLPLFHPLGNLAMSLPPLDPTEYGLPLLSTPDDRDSRPQSRSKRSATKVPEGEEETNGGSSTMSNIAAVAAREVKERASPRKRRAGGAKRKRRDADDGDATYPAKRTRVPRGGAGHGGGAEDDSPVDSMEMSENAIRGGPVPEVLSDPTDNSIRRSTRAKGSLKRRDSGASETTSITANGETPNPDTMGAAASHKNNDNSQGEEEKEEGEVSDGPSS